jgi:hypothetical protein
MASTSSSETVQPASRTTPVEATIAQSIQPRAAQDGVLFSPSLAAILNAYNQDGHGDKELLKALLHAKAKEDEVLIIA